MPETVTIKKNEKLTTTGKGVHETAGPKGTNGSTGKKAFTVLTWGCQMNVDDSDQIENLLQDDGMEKTDDLSRANVIVLNTCSVRQKPEDKVFSKLGELA